MQKERLVYVRSGVNDSEFNLSRSVHSSYKQDFHAHDKYEIFYFLAGRVQYYIEDRSYYLMPGNILIIPPDTMHRPVVIDEDIPYNRMILMIEPQYCKRLLDRARESFVWHDIPASRIILDGKESIELNRTMNSLLALQNTKTDFLKRDCYCTLLLLQLHRLIENAPKEDSAPQLRMQQVIHYINNHFTETLSLEDIAKRFYLSKYHLLRQFKAYTNMTVHSYILAKRILLSKALLKEGLSAQEVSSACGFSTYGGFYKTFVSQTGISPTQFIKQE